jgi:hypothetical protein
MPLVDHFHDPKIPPRLCESFHTWWATSIGDALNRSLPKRYVAAIQAHLGTMVEADVAELERLDDTPQEVTNGPGGGVAVAAWAPPVTTLVMPAVFPDDLEVQVFDQDDSFRLVGVVEVVSPSNKDRPATRRAFACKCATYLQRGIGLIVVDIVTNRHFNLHNDLVRVMELAEPFLLAHACSTYAVAYRPVRRQQENQIDLWPVSLTVGGPLPLLPLALRGFRPVPVDLEATYTDARQRSRL